MKKRTFVKTSHLFIISILILISASSATAGIIRTGYKEIDYNFQLVNMDEFSEYKFIAVFTTLGLPYPYIVLNDSLINYSSLKYTDIRDYKIYAIKEADFNLSEIEGGTVHWPISETSHCYYAKDQPCVTSYPFFENNPKVFSSETLDFKGAIQESNPRESLLELFQVVKIEDNDIILKKLTPEIKTDIFPYLVNSLPYLAILLVFLLMLGLMYRFLKRKKDGTHYQGKEGGKPRR